MIWRGWKLGYMGVSQAQHSLVPVCYRTSLGEISLSGLAVFRRMAQVRRRLVPRKRRIAINGQESLMGLPYAAQEHAEG